MDELARRLKAARTRRKMTLEVAGRAASISTAYLHKLEAGRVRTPSPHVLRRLAGVLDMPYLDLMVLSGYLDRPETVAVAKKAHEARTAREEKSMNPSTAKAAPTNAEVIRLLHAIQGELGALKRGQDDLAKKLAKMTSGKNRG